MTTVNMLDAKTNLSKLVEAIESGVETEIIIARNGKPAARLTALSPKKREIKFGLAKGKFVAPDDFDADNDLIAKMFYGAGHERAADPVDSRPRRCGLRRYHPTRLKRRASGAGRPRAIRAAPACSRRTTP